MRRYNGDDERRIRMQARVRDWMRAGLLRPEQGAALTAQLRADVKRTNDLLRAALALFTVLIRFKKKRCGRRNSFFFLKTELIFPQRFS